MTTVILVHGTGVRERSYQESLSRVVAGIAVHRDNVSVKPCFWGAQLGASLDVRGLSVPGGREWQPPERDSEEWQIARWALLDVGVRLAPRPGERIKETPAVWKRARNFRGGEPEMQRAVIAGISLSISIPQCDCQRVKFV